MTTERFTIFGDVGAAPFLPWIGRHARRLGVTSRIASATARRIELTVEGPLPLLDAMELGCSLGPIEVWVDSIRREPVQGSGEGASLVA
jgi:acylphosphatase